MKIQFDVETESGSIALTEESIAGSLDLSKMKILTQPISIGQNSNKVRKSQTRMVDTSKTDQVKIENSVALK